MSLPYGIQTYWNILKNKSGNRFEEYVIHDDFLSVLRVEGHMFGEYIHINVLALKDISSNISKYITAQINYLKDLNITKYRWKSETSVPFMITEFLSEKDFLFFKAEYTGDYISDWKDLEENLITFFKLLEDIHD